MEIVFTRIKRPESTSRVLVGKTLQQSKHQPMCHIHDVLQIFPSAMNCHRDEPVNFIKCLTFLEKSLIFSLKST